jgi:hypothetical protein
MSNLSFKTFAHPVFLKKFLNEGRYKDNRQLAYATWVSENDGAFLLSHHNSVIAQIEDWRVMVANCGYTSSTTRARINQVLRDNDIPFYVAQRNYSQILFQRGKDGDTVITDNFRSAEFTMIAGVWEVTL